MRVPGALRGQCSSWRSAVALAAAQDVQAACVPLPPLTGHRSVCEPGAYAHVNHGVHGWQPPYIYMYMYIHTLVSFSHADVIALTKP